MGTGFMSIWTSLSFSVHVWRTQNYVTVLLPCPPYSNKKVLCILYPLGTFLTEDSVKSITQAEIVAFGGKWLKIHMSKQDASELIQVLQLLRLQQQFYLQNCSKTSCEHIHPHMHPLLHIGAYCHTHAYVVMPRCTSSKQHADMIRSRLHSVIKHDR